jgi:hypothetical protein
MQETSSGLRSSTFRHAVAGRFRKSFKIKITRKTAGDSTHGEGQDNIRTIYCGGEGEQDGDPSHPPPPPVATFGSETADLRITLTESVDFLKTRTWRVWGGACWILPKLALFNKS